MQFTTLALLGLASMAAAASNATYSITKAPEATVSPVGANCQKSFVTCQANGDQNCEGSLSTCQSTCYTSYTNCRAGADANMASCASAYAACLGKNPFASNGTNTVTPGAVQAGDIAYTTEVVTAFTTYCPGNTAVTYNGQTYSISSAGTITITNCPCTITRPVQAAGSATAAGSSPANPTSGAGTGSSGSGSGSSGSTGTLNGNVTSTGNSSSSTPEAFTGAGSKLIVAGSSLAVGVIGAIFFL